MVESVREKFREIYRKKTGKDYCTTRFGEKVTIDAVASLIKLKGGKIKMSFVTGALVEAGEVRDAYRKAKRLVEKNC